MFLEAGYQGFAVGKTVTEAQGLVSAIARDQVSSDARLMGNRELNAGAGYPRAP